ncbi:MAG: short-chain dehydrogenase [Phycisphaerae bacterium]|nr:short-chain dehydrogenase [Phycisphaerae bacterium]
MPELPSFSLDGLNAVVCGSTQGIGRACAEAFADAGASITLVGRNEQALGMVKDGLAKSQSQCHGYLVADFSVHESLRTIIGDWVAEGGRAHILVNNTGGPPAGAGIDGEAEAFAMAFEQHIMCNQVLAQALVPGMREFGYGRIINIISTSVIAPIKGLGISNTIRGSVANWGRTLACELAQFGITVNNLLPGFTDTARLESLLKGKASRMGSTLEEVRDTAFASIPAGRFATPQETAAVATFLASPAAAYVNGVNLPVDGGRTAGQ